MQSSTLALRLDEFWRERIWDSRVLGWMSKGQLLTIPMIAIGIFFAVRRCRHGAVPKG